jgi:serine/threonine protein kinase
MTPVTVGQVLAGKYEVEHVLGSGGMGVVVAARHIHLGERVAIKFLLPQAMKRDEVVQRFLREGRAAVRIKSEHVARVIDVGKLDDGAPYMVMEFLQGADLSALLKTKGAVPVDLAVEYVLQACEAMAEAHSIGIIHRDLKPANLFVTKRADGSPVVKVIDFGISKVADPTSEGDVEMTKTDVMMGSPVYMAPEQMISARDVDVRADVWSLGIILYYLVMGTQPFKGGSVTQLYASILEGPPTMRPSRPDIPEGLEKAIARCLQAVPKDRWNNVAELALAIAEFAPPHARVSADRAARTLGVVPVHKSTPPPSIAGSITPPAVAATAVRGADASTGPHTDGSWGHTQGPLQRKRSRNVLLAAGGLVVAGLAGVAVVALLRAGPLASSGAAPDPSPITVAGSVPSIGGATVVTPAASSSAPVAVPPPVAIAPATATASASAQASAKPTGAPGTGVRVPGTARPVSTKPKGGGDLFSDPH